MLQALNVQQFQKISNRIRHCAPSTSHLQQLPETPQPANPSLLSGWRTPFDNPGDPAFTLSGCGFHRKWTA
jgi:hypothetical protein